VVVTKYGMDAKVGQRTYAPKPQGFLPVMQDTMVSAAEATAREIDVAVRDLIEAGNASAIPRSPPQRSRRRCPAVDRKEDADGGRVRAAARSASRS
jgi:hypothetical protein